MAAQLQVKHVSKASTAGGAGPSAGALHASAAAAGSGLALRNDAGLLYYVSMCQRRQHQSSTEAGRTACLFEIWPAGAVGNEAMIAVGNDATGAGVRDQVRFSECG